MNAGVKQPGVGDDHALRRDMGFWSVIATVLTSVIGGGLFLTTVAIQNELPIGSSLIWAYLVAAVPALFVALCYAALSSAMPTTGGDYIYISRILDPYIGFIVTWMRWFGMVGGIAAIAIGDLSLVAHMLRSLGSEHAAAFVTAHRTALAVATIVVFLAVNYVGVRIYARVQGAMLAVLSLGLLVYVGFGLPHVTWEQLEASARGDFDQVMRAASVVFFSFIGFAAIASAGGEVRNPRRNLPLGMVASTGLVTLIYVAVAVVTYGAAPLDTVVAAGNVPAAAGLFLSSSAALFVSFTAFTALVSDISPGMLATSRLALAWAQDGVAPARLAALSRFGTPGWTLGLIGATAIVIVMAFESFIEAIDVTTIAILLTYSIVCMSVLVMPYKRPDLWAASAVRFRGMWLVSILGLVSCQLLLGYLIGRSTVQFEAVVIWLGLGSALYHFTRKDHQLECTLIREAEAGLRAAAQADGD